MVGALNFIFSNPYYSFTIAIQGHRQGGCLEVGVLLGILL